MCDLEPDEYRSRLTNNDLLREVNRAVKGNEILEWALELSYEDYEYCKYQLATRGIQDDLGEDDSLNW